MNKPCTLALLSAASLGATGTASASSLLHSLISGITGNNTVSFTLNDDDQATFVDLTGDQVDIQVPVLNVLGLPIPGEFIDVEPLQAGDEFNGVVSFPSIDIANFGTNIDLGGFELTGTYTLGVVSIDGLTASLEGSIQIFEDSSPDADFGDLATFDGSDVDSVLLGSFTIITALSTLTSNSLVSPNGIGSTSSGAVPVGVGIPGSSVSISASFDGDGLFGDPSLFGDFGLANFGFDLQGPVSGFDFGSDGGVTISAEVVPSPAAAGVGVIGVLGLLGIRRRRREEGGQ